VHRHQLATSLPPACHSPADPIETANQHPQKRWCSGYFEQSLEIYPDLMRYFFIYPRIMIR
jgi:hypothetical protein